GSSSIANGQRSDQDVQARDVKMSDAVEHDSDEEKQSTDGTIWANESADEGKNVPSSIHVGSKIENKSGDEEY
ncbi:hypothetical protein AVEN_55160-2, partial [Araneus ventricosus]